MEDVLDFLINPIKSDIPKEIVNDIYAAEANTPAAKERGKRVVLYLIIAFLGFLGVSFNAFLTELRFGDIGPDEVPFVIEESMFAWVPESGLAKFFFMNKIGGLMLLFSGLAGGFMVEAEFDTRRKNAEKIWEELQRRREAAAKKRQKKAGAPLNRKKRESTKKLKRMEALAEVLVEEPATEAQPIVEATEMPPKEAEKKKQGVFGALKDLYQKADSMAASQALLLNKELEERGVVEKITDETGLRVIGREEAKKLETGKDQKPSSQ